MASTAPKCATPNCTNTSYRLHCPSCLAQIASERLLQAGRGACIHGRSITGDFDMIQRLLPAYNGGHPQPGYMLDVCGECLKELEERPYKPSRTSGRRG